MDQVIDGLDPRTLPIREKEQEILDALQSHRVLIVAAPTGSGKTTQLPQMLHKAGYRSIVVTQPRRVAATSVARRVAQELGVPLGTVVGYQVRFDKQVLSKTPIRFVTEGVLLQEAKSDSLFSRYQVVMLDEVHERTIDMDVLLGLTKLALQQRDDLKVIISSATINVEKLEAFFAKEAVTVSSDGRLFPVDVFYEERESSPWWGRGSKMSEVAAKKVVEIITQWGVRRSILVFLSGWDEIENARKLINEELPTIPIDILHGEMPLEEQEWALRRMPFQRIVLATNVAETSVTPLGIAVVIDTGVEKISCYDPQTGITALKEAKIAQANAEQRRGRAGRVEKGWCIRLWTEEDHRRRPLYSIPEILRSDIEHVVLRLRMLGITDITSFPFLDPPQSTQINNAYRKLVEIGALDQDNGVTAYGEFLYEFPLSPSLSHLLVCSYNEGCLTEMAIVIPFLEQRTVFRRCEDSVSHPPYQRWLDHRSDFGTYLRVWQAYEDAGFVAEWARNQGLNRRVLNEVRQVRDQLLAIAADLHLGANDFSLDNLAKLHAALIKARPFSLARPHYVRKWSSHETVSGQGCFIHPASHVKPAAGDQMMIWFAQSRETSRLFLLHVFSIDIEDAHRIISDRIVKKTEIISKYNYTCQGEVKYYRYTYMMGGCWLASVEEIDQEDFLIKMSQLQEEEEGSHQAIARALAREAERSREMRANRERAQQLHLARKGFLQAEMAGIIISDDDPFRQEVERWFADDAIYPLGWITEEKFQLILADAKAAKQRFLEKEEMIELCWQTLQDKIKEVFSRCPICFSTFSCRCKCPSYSLDYRHIRHATDIITINSDKGQLLAKVYITPYANGKPQVVESWCTGREEMPIFNNLVVEISKI